MWPPFAATTAFNRPRNPAMALFTEAWETGTFASATAVSAPATFADSASRIPPGFGPKACSPAGYSPGYWPPAGRITRGHFAPEVPKRPPFCGQALDLAGRPLVTAAFPRQSIELREQAALEDKVCAALLAALRVRRDAGRRSYPEFRNPAGCDGALLLPSSLPNARASASLQPVGFNSAHSR